MKKILVIEDEPAYLKLLKSQLTKKGYKVLGAADGKKGLEKAKSEYPDLILLDLNLPIMDGLSVLYQLRKDKCNNKVIILTNSEPDEKIISGVYNDHPLYYFVKSNTKFKDLLEKIANVISS